MKGITIKEYQTETMKLYNPKNNKTYDSLHDLPLQKGKNTPKGSKSKLSNQYDSSYEFFFKGKQLKAQEIQQLIESNAQSQDFVIVGQNNQNRDTILQKVSYESHRDVIENYLKTTKTDNKQKIKQNAEFIFEKAIDGNFKYHTVEYFQLEHEFTAERKEKLLNEVFLKLCKDSSDQINTAERRKKEDKQVKEQVKGKESKQRQQQKQKETEIEKEKEKEIEKIQPLQRQQLELHELQYITENWKQLICINKNLLKTNLDNPSYYKQLVISANNPRISHANESEEMRNSEIREKEDNSKSEFLETNINVF